MRKIFFIALLLLSPITLSLSPLFAQKEMMDVWRGNRQYKKENYTLSEIDYRRGAEANKNSYEAHYNIGDALYKQDKYEDALGEFETAAKMLNEKKDKVMHNIGNCNYQLQNYGQAVDAYQRSLRANPKDDETRYNLVQAMKMVQQQQQQQQQDQNQQQQQQQQQQEEQQQQQQQEQLQDENQMDKETAEQILQALEQDEQDTQEKLQRQQGKKRRVEKDW